MKMYEHPNSGFSVPYCPWKALIGHVNEALKSGTCKLGSRVIEECVEWFFFLPSRKERN